MKAFHFIPVLATLLLLGCQKKDEQKISMKWWLTKPDKTALLNPQPNITFSTDTSSAPTITIDTTQQFQSIDGFGFSLTGGSAQLINALPEQKRDSLLHELFDSNGNGIGVSFLRISIGASDLDDHVFSYDDLPLGKTDLSLEKFSLQEDQKNLIPVLKKIISIYPRIKIMGSPWSAPAWMKTNINPKGGSLKKEFYAAYAQYFVKYILAMRKEGITLHSVTIQNEPENPNNTPSMLMTAEEQSNFIREHLGPAFQAHNLSTKIILFDHNCDNPQYPISILNDAKTRQFVDGSAFHMYLGEIDAMSTTRNAYPEKNIYFTEQWTSGDGEFSGDLKWHTENLIIGATRNWSRTVLEWNLAADPSFNPHTPDDGCDRCLGALTIGDNITRNVSYYIIAHASKFVRPGSNRILSSEIEDLPNVAFITPTGEKVLIVLNTKDQEQPFQISYANQAAQSSLPAGAVATYVWK